MPRARVLGLVSAMMWTSVGCAIFSEPRPTPMASDRADAVAQSLEQFVNREAWERTGVVQWTFAEKNRHLWDRHRGLARVQWSDQTVLLDLQTRKGVACVDGAVAEGEDLEEAVSEAYARWTNDSFWLNPLVKLFDDGVERAIATDSDGTQGLLVTYRSGGLTPGDAYFWITDESGAPVRWKMWTSNIPIGGVSATWERWAELKTGAKVSTFHDIGAVDLELTNLAGAEHISDMTSEDPFAPMVDSTVSVCQAPKRSA